MWSEGKTGGHLGRGGVPFLSGSKTLEINDAYIKLLTTHKRPILHGTFKLSGGDQVFRKSTFIRDYPERGAQR